MDQEGDPRDPSEHPKVLENEDPPFMINAWGTVVGFLQSYGWFIFLGLIVYLYFRDKINKQVYNAQRKVENLRENASYDAEAVQRRQMAMDEARRRLQEQHDADAQRFAEKQQQKEEEKRKEKIEDWDRHLKGGGYRSKYKPTEEPGTSGATGSSKKSTAKKVYRDNDYNPLMGGAPGAGVRPARRGGARGG